MTIIDVWPGDYYGKILAPYLGKNGKYIAANYDVDKTGKDEYTGPIATPEQFSQLETEYEKIVAGWTNNGISANTIIIREAPNSLEGTAGYLKQSRVVDAFTKAGFVFEASSEINANPKDDANSKNNDIVWRLPPAFEVEDEHKEKYIAIGESNRMTLRFRKPK